MAIQPKIITAYDDKGNEIYKGGTAKGLKLLNIHVSSYYKALRKELNYLPYNSKAQMIITHDGRVLIRNSKKFEHKYTVGYQFHFKGTKIVITKVQPLSNGNILYTFNNNFSVEAKAPFRHYSTLYTAVKRSKWNKNQEQ